MATLIKTVRVFVVVHSALDDCGVCDGGNADQDCAGVCFGDSALDDCGDCDGGNADYGLCRCLWWFTQP